MLYLLGWAITAPIETYIGVFRADFGARRGPCRDRSACFGVVYSGLCLILLGFVGRAELFLFLVLPKPSHDAAELSMQHVRLGPVWGIPNMGNMASHEPPCIRA